MYGLQKIATEHLKQFARGLRSYSHRHVRLRVFRAVSGLVPGDPLCSLAASEFQVRALELLIESIDRDKLYAGIKGAQLWSQLGKSDVLMIPAKYYEEVAERLRKDAERLQRRLHAGRAGGEKADRVRPAAGAPPVATLTLSPNATAHPHPYISPISPVYLPCISPISRPPLPAAPRDVETDAEKQARRERRQTSVRGAVAIVPNPSSP
jgi:hypothetical protein